VILVAGVAALILSSLALLHFYWAFGGGWGAKDAVPQRKGKPLFKPGPGACTAVAALLVRRDRRKRSSGKRGVSVAVSAPA
jgi:hypothetical protein